MMTSSSIHRHLLPSTIETLSRVEKIVEDIKDDHNISDEIYGNILVSITEAVSNAIKHGNQYDKEKEIEFSFEQDESNYIFTVIDQGKGFDYDHIPDPTHPDNLEKTDGRGIFIMKNLSDDVEFTNDGRTVKISFIR